MIIIVAIFHCYVTGERSFGNDKITIKYQYFYNGQLTTKIYGESEQVENVANIPLFQLANPVVMTVVHKDLYGKTVEIIPIRYNDVEFGRKSIKVVKTTDISLIDYLKCFYAIVE